MVGFNARGSGALVFVAVLAFVIGLVGYVGLGWRFGETSDTLPMVLGVAFALVAVGVALRRRL
jgi:uncharacterized membrane-anchored protein